MIFLDCSAVSDIIKDRTPRLVAYNLAFVRTCHKPVLHPCVLTRMLHVCMHVKRVSSSPPEVNKSSLLCSQCLRRTLERLHLSKDKGQNIPVPSAPLCMCKSIANVLSKCKSSRHYGEGLKRLLFLIRGKEHLLLL